MLELSDIDYTIWQCDEKGLWTLVAAIDGPRNEATRRADEMASAHPENAYGVRTATPVHLPDEKDRVLLKNAFYYGKPQKNAA